MAMNPQDDTAFVRRVEPETTPDVPSSELEPSGSSPEPENKQLNKPSDDVSDDNSSAQRPAKPLSDEKDSEGESTKDKKDLKDKEVDDASEEGEEPENEDEKPKGDLDGLKTTLKGAAAAGTAGKAASMAAMTIMFQKFLAMMMALAQAAIAAVTSAIAAIVTVIVQAVVAVATAIGVSILVAAFGIFAVVAVAVVAVVAVATSANVGTDVARADDYVAPCSVDVEKYKGTGEAGDASEAQMAQAQSIYSVMTEYGLSKYHIAGMLGNFQSESGIDSTSIEGIYNEPYYMGPRKLAAQSDFNAYYTLNGYNGPGYKAEGGNYGGIGLGQWTAGRHLRLRRFAESVNLDWHNIDAQLMFMISPAGEASYIAPFAAKTYTNSDEASDWWLEVWEVPAGIDQARPIRRQQSLLWLMRLNEMVADKTYANSIIQLAEAVVVNGADQAANKALADCVNSKIFDNSSIAMAAASYAHPSADAAENNNGTALYQKVVAGVTGQSGLFQSCDINVTSAIRWSGTDDDFPLYLGDVGISSSQSYYLRHSDKWEQVHWNDDVTKLQPGDIFNGPGEHTVIYTGHDAIARFHPDKADDTRWVVVGASHPGYLPDGTMKPSGGRSAGVEQLWGGEYYNGNRGYEVFRNIKSDKSMKYRHVGSSQPSEVEIDGLSH